MEGAPASVGARHARRSPHIVALAAGFCLLVAAGVSIWLLLRSDAQPPPRIDAAGIVDFWVGPADTPDGAYRPVGSFASLVTAYNKASPASFNTDTTPALFATAVLRDGTRIALVFSPDFPRDHVLVSVDPPPGKPPAGSPEVPLPGVKYKADAPGLLAAVWELSRGHLRAATRASESDWLPR